jgi:hypothetical protein
MANFINTVRPTAFGFFDSEPAFQSEADSMVTFVKRKLGDSSLSVELTSRDIWTCFEEACLEYGKHINNNVIMSQLTNVLGQSTASLGDMTNKYPRSSLDFLMRLAEPYADAVGVGGSYETITGYIELESGVQTYNIYSKLKLHPAGTLVYDSLDPNKKGKMRVLDIHHYDPSTAFGSLLNTSNIQSFLANQFNYEAYVNTTVFYVLPVFEDVLRRGMLEEAQRVRRSHYTYQLQGGNIKIYPVPDRVSPYYNVRLWVRVAPPTDPLTPNYGDSSISGSVTGPHNMPFSNIPYTSINAPGKQWIRQFTLALCTELLGHVRSKFDSVPIPDADLKLDGENLISHAREDKEKLLTELKELLAGLTQAKLVETEADTAEQLLRKLRLIPFSKPIFLK